MLSTAELTTPSETSKRTNASDRSFARIGAPCPETCRISILPRARSLSPNLIHSQIIIHHHHLRVESSAVIVVLFLLSLPFPQVPPLLHLTRQSHSSTSLLCSPPSSALSSFLSTLSDLLWFLTLAMLRFNTPEGRRGQEGQSRQLQRHIRERHQGREEG